MKNWFGCESSAETLSFIRSLCQLNSFTLQKWGFKTMLYCGQTEKHIFVTSDLSHNLLKWNYAHINKEGPNFDVKGTFNVSIEKRRHAMTRNNAIPLYVFCLHFVLPSHKTRTRSRYRSDMYKNTFNHQLWCGEDGYHKAFEDTVRIWFSRSASKLPNYY